EKYHEELIYQEIFNSSHFFFAGLAPASHIFGYQIAGGFLIISLFFAEKNTAWKLIWAPCSVLLLVVVTIFGERSIIPAFAIGLITFIVLSPKIKIKNRKTLNERFILFLFFVISFLLIFRIVYLNQKRTIQDKPLAFIHERFKAGDIRIRLGMQLAAIEIILEEPFGLFWKGINEEDWGYIANAKGYEVVPDANNIDYSLVHNGYLRLVLYFGVLIGLCITVVLIFIFKRLKYFKAKNKLEDSEGKRYGRAVGASLLTLLVQAMFHNNSIFTFDKTTWITFCFFIIWAKHNSHVVDYKQPFLKIKRNGLNG
ncbi:MAG: O-antigen ligase family protein, partial [Candidatus Hodarchaeota archaeon]